MTRDQALRKIRACLARSKSCNPHEAAIALRQAQKLMVEYGLTETDADHAQYRTTEAKTRSRGRSLRESIAYLAMISARLYGCEYRVVRGVDFTRVRFYGMHGRAEIAEYTFTFLRRSLESATRTYFKRRHKSPSKQDSFEMGWMYGVLDAIGTENLCKADPAIVAFADYENRDMIKSNERGRNASNDFSRASMDGFMQGSQVKLRSGVRGAGQSRLGQ